MPGLFHVCFENDAAQYYHTAPQSLQQKRFPESSGWTRMCLLLHCGQTTGLIVPPEPLPIPPTFPPQTEHLYPFRNCSSVILLSAPQRGQVTSCFFTPGLEISDICVILLLSFLCRPLYHKQKIPDCLLTDMMIYGDCPAGQRSKRSLSVFVESYLYEEVYK